MSVFANGLEVSGKATPNKTIAAMPDVCMSPPPPPAGPVPIPYPLTGMASDTTDGCTSVFVKGKEAGKKNSTKYSKTTGDEPATNSFGAGLITHKITGPLRFAAYSFDVILEGGGACRFTDLTTQNHMNAGDGSMGMSGAGANPPPPSTEQECAELKKQNEDFRKDHNTKVIKKTKEKDGKTSTTTFDESGTVCHGKLTSGGSSSTLMGTSATRQLQKAGVQGQCQPVSTTGIAAFRSEGISSNAQFAQMPNKDFKPPPAEGPDTRSDRAKKETVVHVKMDICDGKCIHPTGGLEAHAELNILNCVARQARDAGRSTSRSDKLLLGIDWNSEKNGKGNPNPCTNCQELIRCVCENQCITLEICDENGKPVNVCDKEDKMEM
jgi:hypothetical protein